MPTDPRKRQKKKEKQAAKRKAKHQQLVQVRSAGLPTRMAGASRYPVLDCWISDTVLEEGLGYVCLSRKLPGQQVAFGLFLVDRYCLGVKNAVAEIAARSVYDNRVTRQLRTEYGSHDMKPACARNFVEGAVAYARDLGLQPHSDYRTARLIFGDINAAECTEEFEYGKNGQPLFIAGPYDTEARCRTILATLARSRGPGGFHYTIPLGSEAAQAMEALELEDALEEEDE
jgi:hypothetical protein